MNASDIQRLLIQKHSDDVYVPECKDGPTQSVSSFAQMDGWAMKKSWSNPLTIGYEIKVSRRDFIGDNKWPKYLPLCNQLYFVCPPKIIAVEECPAQCGLMWVASTGTVLYTKKKAPHREVQIPEALFRYILMCRTKIVADPEHDRRAYWLRAIEEAKSDKATGYELAGLIRKTFGRRCEELEKKEAAVSRRESTLASIEGLLTTNGLSTWDMERIIREHAANRPPLELVKRLHDVSVTLNNIISECRE